MLLLSVSSIFSFPSGHPVLASSHSSPLPFYLSLNNMFKNAVLVQDVNNPISLPSFYCMEVVPFLLDPLKYTGCFIMFSVITNIYNKKTRVPALVELFTGAGKLKKFVVTN
jgi:membrane-associated phospholipid phosphatase